ncbi:MAG: RsmE family RNA methyltransferase [Nitriliruptoraceae bacterium]
MSLTPYVHLDVSLVGMGVGTRLALSERDQHHLTRVLRLPVGAHVVVADGDGASAPATLADRAVALTSEATLVPGPSPRLVLAQALPKGRKLDDVLRRATELGVDEIRVLATARSVSGIAAGKRERVEERWAAVVRAASEQARRPRRPPVVGPMPLDRLGRDDELLLLAHPAAPGLPELDEPITSVSTIVLAIGPEGGFTDAEVSDAVASGALAVGLGPTVLRTEHAGVAGLAVLAAGTGRWTTRC